MKRWFLLPPLFVAVGVAWMIAAVKHFERVTGRGFYGLAGYQTSWPKDEFHPAPMSDAIQRWAIDIPSAVILALLLACGVVITLMDRSQGFRFLFFWWLTVVACASAFIFAGSWIVINIHGLFI